MSDKKEVILNVANDAMSDFLYYDRKECEDLPRGAIEEAIIAGEITVEEILNEFENVIRDTVYAHLQSGN